jgi:ubiquinone/menaquinone biosynthesis C-methylase UbiE
MQTHSPLKTAGFAHPVRNVAMLGIEPGMAIADFGAGSGVYTIAIAKRLEGVGRVYAIDIQRDLLQRIKNESHRGNFHNVEVLWADLEVPGATKIADGKLDLVLISNLLFQIEQKAMVLAEANRILRMRGRFAIIDWLESFGGTGPIKEHVVSKDEAIGLGESAGAKFEREFNAGAHHYGLIFKKRV